ncbi:3'-5' exoribonuclease [Laribacter hongkongensis]|uniref:3'-5' exoribonuclease n=1 Tax=Laribacter hongkongensis TaxID=168471 RepID=UPI001EFDFDB9|nr:3'-5' exoribonuclease [Laribacter hongkongensis]MCG9096670.1 3'-5' exoribonuclease [Laribacter hongkongensis]
MLIFLDTEYTDPIQIDLISIGIVSEDGSVEFYAERSDYRTDDCNAFVNSVVLPLLDAPPDSVMSRVELAIRLRAWFTTLPRRVVVACDDRTDYELLIDALDGQIPPNLAGVKDVRPLIGTTTFHAAACRYHESPGCPWHHALHDARAHRAGWLAWMDANKART